MLTHHSRSLVLLLLISMVSVAENGGVDASFSSGERRVALVELYTSEGCSSCPPADRWFTKLKADPGLWKRFVPVAFHVDYWDYIGWQDRFARADYSARQRQYAEEGAATAVYTPGLFRGGKDWRGWRNGETVAIDRQKAGVLSVIVANNSAEVHFDSLDATARQYTVHLALLGMNLRTAVRAGENRGRSLSHDFVALNLVSVPLERSGSGYTAITKLPDKSAEAEDVALAVWVSKEGAQKPVQAVGGYL